MPGYVTPTTPAVGDLITAAQGAAVAGDLATGPNMGTPTATSSSGTVTSAGTEIRDAVLGNYVFTAVAGRRYRAVLDGLILAAGVVNDNVGARIRNGGGSTPTASSTLIASAQTVCVLTGGSGQVSLPGIAGSFVPGAGTVTLGAFTIRIAGTGVETPVGTRELYAVDIGPA